MVSQPDIAVIQEAGHVDLIHLLPSVSPVTRTRFSYRSRPASSVQPYNLVSVNTWYSTEGLSAAEAWIPGARSSGMGCQGSAPFSQAEELKMKTRRHATYKTRRFFSPAKSILVILVMLFLSRSLQGNKKKTPVRYLQVTLTVYSVKTGLDWGDAACQGVGDSDD